MPTPAFSIEQALGKLEEEEEVHRRRREKHEQSHCQDEERVHMHTAFQPAVYCKLSLALAKNAGHFKTGEEQRAESFEHGGEDLTDAYRGSCSRKRKESYAAISLW